MQDLTFDELMKKSNKALESLQNGKGSHEDVTELMKEFTRRLEVESTSLQNKVNGLKKQLNIPTLKLVNETN